MSLFDGLLGNVLSQLGTGGTAGTSQSALVNAALQLIQQNGGLSGLLARFQQAGLGAHADSWVSTGQNMPISADQLQQVLGSGQLGQIASSLNMSHQDTAGGLASVLPQLIDRLTPQGQVPANHGDLVSQALSALQGMRSA